MQLHHLPQANCAKCQELRQLPISKKIVYEYFQNGHEHTFFWGTLFFGKSWVFMPEFLIFCESINLEKEK